LPERIGGERNYDYRFCWIRDASFVVRSFLSIGLDSEANAFVAWLMHATHQTAPRLAPIYTLFGNQRAPERELRHFDGYRGSRPVRVGNLAAGQHQFDVYGELIDAIHHFIKDQRRHVADEEATFISSMADHVAHNWRAPDHGIWEARIGPLQYTHSKVMAWDALQHAAMLVDEGRIQGDASLWRSEAAEIHDLVLSHAYNHKLGAFTQTLDGDQLDSAVLLMSLVGFIDPADPRMQSTIEVLRHQLETDGFIARYSGFDDGLPPGESAFVACNFWLAAALATAGRIDDAHAVFHRTTDAMNDLGLMAEEYDPRSGEMLGNFPQGLSHLTLINAALAIADAERKPPIRRWSTPK
jgi:GH15 family glucan-1,4-alpha-glucosidase